MLSKPVIGPITSRFGPRPTPPSPHNGLDYGWLLADGGTKSRDIYAPGTGVVSVGRNDLIGNFVSIAIDPNHVVRLCHLASVAVRTGQTVTRGQFVGRMGDTGSQASGVHLHMDMYVNSIRVDPEPYITMPFFALSGGETIPIVPVPNFGEDMIVYANVDTNAWAAGIPFGGTWVTVPSGQGDAYVKASGRDLVRLSNAEFTIVAGICKQRGSADVRLYADTSSNVWYLLGAGVEYAVPGDKAGLFESLFGTRVPLSSGDIAALRAAFAQAGGSGTAPTAEENASAVEVKLADNFARIAADVWNHLKIKL